MQNFWKIPFQTNPITQTRIFNFWPDYLKDSKRSKLSAVKAANVDPTYTLHVLFIGDDLKSTTQIYINTILGFRPNL